MENEDWNLDYVRPTSWPPSLGLLAPDWMALPRDQWNTAQWREYAELLEKEGHLLTLALERSQADLRDRDAKLRRSKADDRPALGLLDAYDRISRPNRPGRPKGSAAAELAMRALLLQDEMRSTHPARKVTAQEALSEVRRRDGKVTQKPIVSDRSVLTAMSAIRRRNHNKSST